MIKLLHLRLANIEDTKALGIVKGICKAYEGALRSCEEFEANRVRIIKRQVEVVQAMEMVELEKGGRRKEGFARKRSAFA